MAKETITYKGYTFTGTAGRRRRLQTLIDLVEGGERSIKVLRERVGTTSGFALVQLAREIGLEMPQDPIPERINPIIDEGIDSGLSLVEISRSVGGITHTAVHQYIVGSGQLSYWKQRKGEVVSEFRQGRASFVSLLLGYAYTKGRPSEVKAIDYVRTTQTDSKLIEKIVGLFDLADDHIAEDGTLNVDQVQRKSDLSRRFCYKLLHRYGYPVATPLVTSSSQEEALNRASGINLSQSDVAYFLGMGDSTVRLFYRRSTLKAPKATFKLGIKSTIPMASQIYEAVDAGFEVGDIPELLDLKPTVVSHALERRTEFEPIIVDGLRTIFNDSTIDTPYVDRRNYL